MRVWGESVCLAIPGRVIHISPTIDPAFRVATVDFSGITKDISLSLTPEARLGDYVLVHVGFALTVLSEEEALKTVEFLRTITGPDELQRELGMEDTEAAS
jgi:hydrogenase expression/formation protein HypC